MKLNIKSLLKDKNVLYIVLFLAVTNLFGYLLMREVDAVIFFLIVGFLTSYFSKNMIVVMLVAMISTNFLLGSKHLGSIKEGQANMGLKKTAPVVSDETNGEEVLEIDVDITKNSEGGEKLDVDITKDSEGGEKVDVEVKEPLAKLSPAPANGKKPKLDYAGTMEAAYDNLDDLLSSDALKNMSADTQRLAEKQKLLMNNIGKLEPVMQKASKLLDGLDMSGINGMVDTLSGTLSKLTGGKK